jgi:7-cyano-7-deazaguanine synthase
MIPIPKAPQKVVTSLSGGLDSTVLAYLLVESYGRDNISAVGFSYGQKNSHELMLAKRTANLLGIKYSTQALDLRIFTDQSSLFSGSSLAVNAVEDTLGIPQTSEYVPYRNLLFATYLFMHCEKTNSRWAAMGFQAYDELGFWDCTPLFLSGLNALSSLNRNYKIELLAPFAHTPKSDIVRLGAELGVPFENTRTCYESDIIACGKCSACSIRRKAFQDAGLIDPIPYASAETL